MFYFVGFLGLQAWETTYQVSLREQLRREEEEEPGYTEVLQQRSGSQNIK